MRRHLMGAFIMLLILLMPVSAMGQGTTGTIRGRVVDRSTGLPLGTVDVFVLETNGTETALSSFTNAEGEYAIINIPPGRYNLRAAITGYSTFEVVNLLVTVDLSTIQDFMLESALLDVGEIVTVTAEKGMIRHDITATRRTYTFEEMEQLPVYTMTDILNLQTWVYTLSTDDESESWISGYRDRGLEQVHMRGGRNAEVAFMIDGVQVTNLVYGGLAASINPFSLSEMVIMAGGMSAEFGNALSGVVNMVTREGGSNFDANFEISTSEFTGLEQDDNRDRTSLRGYIGGPVPVVSKLNFFLSGSASTQRDFLVGKDDITFDLTPISSPRDDYRYNDDYPYFRQVGPDGRWIHPFDIYSGWLGYGFDNRWNGLLNLSYRLTPAMKLMLSSSINGRWGAPYNRSWRYSMLWGLPQWFQDHLTWGTLEEDWEVQMWGYKDPPDDPYSDRSLLVPDSGRIDFENEKNVLREDNFRQAVVWTHQPNRSTFYTLRFSCYDYDRTTRSRRWVNEDGYVSSRDHYMYDHVSGITDTLWRPDDPMHQVTLLYIPHGFYQPHYGSSDSLDVYERTYGYNPWSWVSWAGYQGSDRYFTDQTDITRSVRGDVTGQVTLHHQVKTGFLYNNLTLDHNDLQYLWEDPPYRTRYRRSPREFAFYLQDKVEYNFFVLNIGLRYDASSSGNVPYWTNPRNPIDPKTGSVVLNPFLTENEWQALSPSGKDKYVRPPVKTGRLHRSLSPRFGISHPVNDRAVIYFNYGHFSRRPVYQHFYLEGSLDDPGSVLIGNPNLEAEKTTHYEFGYKHQFSGILRLEITMWAKETSNMVGSEHIPAFFGGAANPFAYNVLLNYDYATAKGFDFALIRGYADFFSGRLNYSFMTTQSNRDDPWQGYLEQHDLETAPKRPTVLGWDKPHRVSATISFHIPNGGGRANGTMRFLQGINANLVYMASAGRPYTPATRAGDLERNSGRRPWTFQWDLKIYRDIEMMGLRYSLFADIRNLFNRRNVMGVFARSGKPDDPGPGMSGPSDWYDRSIHYTSPRVINLGLRFYL